MFLPKVFSFRDFRGTVRKNPKHEIREKQKDEKSVSPHSGSNKAKKKLYDSPTPLLAPARTLEKGLTF
jgi:hypothetical protein